MARIRTIKPGVGLVDPARISRSDIGADPLRRGEGMIYRFISASGDCIYIGYTTSPLNRWQAHSRKHWWPEVAAIHYTTELSARQALRMEGEDILAERPRYNRTVKH